MRAGELERYLHAHIPLSARMGVRVQAVDADGVTLAAPLAPNLNHRSTVFGGSASALAILAAWSLVHVRLPEGAGGLGIVIQRNAMEYLRPMRGDFSARALAPAEGEWSRLRRVLERRGRARIMLRAEVWSGGELSGRFEGEYVVLRPGRGAEGGAGGGGPGAPRGA